MSVLSRISDNIDQLRQIISDTENRLRQSPDSFALKLQLDSCNNQLKKMQSQLYHQNLKREKEVVEIRLIGQHAHFGSLPLYMVGGLTNSLSQAIFNASKFKMFGDKGGKEKEIIARETIDLRLEGMGRGSTVFYLSGKTSPDIFGESVIQKTLDNTFELLNTEDTDALMDKLSGIGHASIKHFSKFMEELNADKLEVDIKWRSPRDTEMLWQGRAKNILRIYNTLNRIEVGKTEEIAFEGELITISAKGRFEILTNNHVKLHGNFSDDLLATMRQFHISDICTGTIEKTVIYNPATGKEKAEYSLKNISKATSP